jgi:hypothetical protein
MDFTYLIHLILNLLPTNTLQAASKQFISLVIAHVDSFHHCMARPDFADG